VATARKPPPSGILQVPIAHAEEVEQVFDAISYCKGGSVVRMVHAVLGERDFTAGLRAYMTQFAYGEMPVLLQTFRPHASPF
jgi:aminopeptidase N